MNNQLLFFGRYCLSVILFTFTPLAIANSVLAQTVTQEDLDLNPEMINSSPVLQRWLKEIPDVLQEIKNDPSFSTRIRLGYSQFPSTRHSGGVNIGVEDVFLGSSGFTLSGDYKTSFNGDRTSLGANFQYYVLPLGNYVNMATVLGYRYLQSNDYSTDGVNLGLKLRLAFSRTGAGDISLTQSFVSPGSAEEVGITTLSLGYAIAKNLRISTDLEKENSHQEKDNRVGLVLEWIP